jgi:hypothetical protein
MFQPGEDPNQAIIPDFTSLEHQDARNQLVDNGLTEDQAARSLAALWTIGNNAAKGRWAERLEREQAERRRAEEEEELRQQTLKEEKEAARLEDRKKNKNKYAPICHAEVPSDPVILPSQYATRMLKKGEFCELYYFTNKGLDDAFKSSLTAEPEALVMMPLDNGFHSWVPAAAVKDPKAVITQDENLSWEQFNEAAPRMITAMKLHDWPEDRVHMFIQFWSALQTHYWRHAPDPLQQRALLLYQAQQRRRWHLHATSGSCTWSLETINERLLIIARESLFNEQRAQQTVSAIQASFSLSSSQYSYSLFHSTFTQLYLPLIYIPFLACRPSCADKHPTSDHHVSTPATTCHGHHVPILPSRATAITRQP